MLKLRYVVATTVLSAAMGLSSANAEISFIDLTQITPTFKPSKDAPTVPDLSQPWFKSKPIASFFSQAILVPPSEWITNEGHFHSAALYIHEHHGTHVDAPNHYVNSDASLEALGIPSTQRKTVDQLTLNELTGKIVVIDISDRTKDELAKNGGVPSPDVSVTDFSDASTNTIGADDIAAIADQIEDGIWLILNLGWGQFYDSGIEDWDSSPYVNALNHPGLTREAVDKLIEIMDRKGVTIAGVAADNLSVDSGQSSKGSDDKWSDSWRGHVRLLQRDILLVENIGNLDALTQANKNQDCTLLVAALKFVGGTGSPARVVAICEG